MNTEYWITNVFLCFEGFDVEAVEEGLLLLLAFDLTQYNTRIIQSSNVMTVNCSILGHEM